MLMADSHISIYAAGAGLKAASGTQVRSMTIANFEDMSVVLRSVLPSLHALGFVPRAWHLGEIEYKAYDAPQVNSSSRYAVASCLTSFVTCSQFCNPRILYDATWATQPPSHRF